MFMGHTSFKFSFIEVIGIFIDSFNYFPFLSGIMNKDQYLEKDPSWGSFTLVILLPQLIEKDRL